MTPHSLLNRALPVGASAVPAARRGARHSAQPRLHLTLATLAVASACALVTIQAKAQTQPRSQPTSEAPSAAPSAADSTKSSGGSQWALGLGVSVRERPYTDADRKFNALPLLFYENDWVRVAGATVEGKLLNHAFSPTQKITGGLLVKYAPEGYKGSDSPRLAGMAERKGGFLGGVGLGWQNPIANVSLDWTSDLSGYSKGQRLQVQVERRFQFGAASLSPRLGAQWMDRKWVDYYYGVRAQEATADRAAYNGEAGVALEAGLRMDYAFQRRHVVFVDLGVTHLPKEVTNSSIVDRSNVPRASVGYLYRF